MTEAENITEYNELISRNEGLHCVVPETKVLTIEASTADQL